MSVVVADLLARLGLDVSGFKSGVADASTQVQKLGQAAQAGGPPIKSMADMAKESWVSASAAIVGAWMAINKAVSYMDQAGKALQVESSFKIMAEAAETSSDSMIESMKRATRSTIDDSDLMVKAVKLMTLSFNPEQILRFSDVVITASQIAGISASEAYDSLADAIANRMPRALVRMGAVTREQMVIVNEAIAAGADSTVLFELAIANLELKQQMLKGTQDAATIALQRFHTTVAETTETIGKGLIIAFDGAYRSLQFYAAGILGLVSAYRSYRSVVYEVTGDEIKAADNREIANTFWTARNDLLAKASKGILEESGEETKATKAELAGAKDKVTARMDELRGIADTTKAVKDAGKDRVDAAAKANDFILKHKLDDMATLEKEWVEFSQWQSKRATEDAEKQAKTDDYVLQHQLAGMATLEKEWVEFSQWQSKRATEDAEKQAKTDDYVLQHKLAGMATLEKEWVEFSQWQSKRATEDAEKQAKTDDYVLQHQLAGMDELEKARLEFSQWEMKNIADQARKTEEAWKNSLWNIEGITRDAFSGVSSAISSSIKGVIMGTQTLQDAFKNVGETVALGLVDSIVKRGLNKVADALIDLLPAISSGLGAVVSWVGSALSFAEGGVVPGGDSRDTIPAMLRPGELVLKPDMAQAVMKLFNLIDSSPSIYANVSASTMTELSGASGVGSLYTGVTPATMAEISGVTPALPMSAYLGPASMFASAAYMAFSDYVSGREIESKMNWIASQVGNAYFDQNPQVLRSLETDPHDYAAWLALYGNFGAGAEAYFAQSQDTNIAILRALGFGGDSANPYDIQNALAVTNAGNQYGSGNPQAYAELGLHANIMGDLGGNNGMSDRDAGGPVWPGWSGTVGGRGPETLTMFPGGGGYVTPNDGTPAAGGGGEILVPIQIMIDGNVLVDVVAKGYRDGHSNLIKYTKARVR
jgi:hypothetical protein